MNIPKFKGVCVEKEISRTELSSLWKCSLRTIQRKLDGESPITIDEAQIFSKRANLTDEEKYAIFLADK